MLQARREGTIAVVAILGALVRPVLAASESSAVVHWRAPPSCPNQASVQEQLNRLLLDEEASEPVVADVMVEAVASLYRARVSISTGSHAGMRVVEAVSCDEVARAAAVIVALAVNPEMAAQLALPPEPGAPVSASPAAPEESHRPAPHVPSTVQSSVPSGNARRGSSHSDPGAADEIELMAAVGLDTGSLPSVSPWMGLGSRYWRGSWGAAVMFAGSTRTHGETRERSGAGGSIGMVWASAGACFRPVRSERLFAAFCAGPEGTLQYGEGTGVQAPESAKIVWPSVGMLGELGYGLGRLRVGALAGLAVPLARPAFYLDDIGTVHRPDPSVRLALVGAFAF